MTNTRKWNGTAAQIALGAVGMPVFVAAMIWTIDMPGMTRGLILLSIVLAVTVVGVLIDVRSQRDMDEMDIAAAGFAARWSTVAVALLAAFTLFFPPMHALVNELYLASRGGMPEWPARMFGMGVIGALLVKGLASIVLRAAWMRSKR